MRMHAEEVHVDEALVRRLLVQQMPQLAELPLVIVEPWGTDNAIWRLGADLVVRLPRIHWAAGQIEREAMWLPRLARYLPVVVPEPVALGESGDGYPFQWAVHLPHAGSKRVRTTPGPVRASSSSAKRRLTMRRITSRGVKCSPAVSFDSSENRRINSSYK